MKNKYYLEPDSVAEYLSMAETVNSAKLIDKLRRYLPQRAKLLEIGSGPGTDWRILTRNFEVIGSDFSPLFLKHLKAHNPEGSFLELDAISLTTDLLFDGIYSNKVLHHLDELEIQQSIKRQIEVLNHNGIICHSFWKGRGSECFKGMEVHYRDRSSLETLFGPHFHILYLEPYTEFEQDDSLLLIAEKRKRA